MLANRVALLPAAATLISLVSALPTRRKKRTSWSRLKSLGSLGVAAVRLSYPVWLELKPRLELPVESVGSLKVASIFASSFILPPSTSRPRKPRFISALNGFISASAFKVRVEGSRKKSYSFATSPDVNTPKLSVKPSDASTIRVALGREIPNSSMPMPRSTGISLVKVRVNGRVKLI